MLSNDDAAGKCIVFLLFLGLKVDENDFKIGYFVPFIENPSSTTHP